MGSKRSEVWAWRNRGVEWLTVECRNLSCQHKGRANLRTLKVNPDMPVDMIRFRCSKCRGRSVWVRPEARQIIAPPA